MGIDWDALVAMILCFMLAWKWMDRGRFSPKQKLKQQAPLVAIGQSSASDVELAKLKLAEQRERRALYEKLALEKLDVMRTAMTMGYKEEELTRLDERLEKLIGSDKLQQLVDAGTLPVSTGDLLDTDFHSEVDRLEKLRTGTRTGRAGER